MVVILPLIIGRALGVCPDAIRSRVRITHVLQCLEVFEVHSRGIKTFSFFTMVCNIRFACHIRPQNRHVRFHHCAQCFVLCICNARNTRFVIPGMDGPNLGFQWFVGLRYPECVTIHGN